MRRQANSGTMRRSFFILEAFASAKHRTLSSTMSEPQAGTQNMLAISFPHLAACWAGIRRGSSLETPWTVSPKSNRCAVWRCKHCLKNFEMNISLFISTNGRCPLCNCTQRFSSGGHESSAFAPYLHSTPQGYQNVLSLNPQWLHENIQPMLACKWQSVSQSNSLNLSELLVSPKIDGYRCLIGYNAQRDELQFFSRNGTLYESCHGLVPELKPLFLKDPKLILDGELFSPYCTFGELSSLARRLSARTTPEMRAIQAHLLFFFAFDVISSQHLSPSAPFSLRYKHLQKLIPHCCVIKKASTNGCIITTIKNEKLKGEYDTIGSKRVFHVPAEKLGSSNVSDVLKKACILGFEGIMIRRPEFPYEHRRSVGLLKLKEVEDAEFTVVGVVPGAGKWKNSLGAFVCATSKGYIFHATPKVPFIEKVKLWADRHFLIGSLVTVQYQELSADGIPRFPIAKCIRSSAVDLGEWF